MRSKRLLNYLDYKISKKHPGAIRKLGSKFSTKMKLIRDGKKVNEVLTEVTEEHVGILFIHDVALTKRINRKRDLVQFLDEESESFLEIQCMNRKELLKAGHFYGSTDESVHFKIYDLYAQYIIKKYSPKVIVVDTNGDYLATFLRKHLGEKGDVIHIAHSVLTAESGKLSLMDFDYYCMYGKSSLEYLQQLDGKYGECKAVLSGSYIFNENHTLPHSDKNMGVLLLGMGPTMERDPLYSRYYQAILEWKIQNPDVNLQIRLHPRSDGAFWKQHEGKVANLSIRPQGEDFKEACRDAFVCITSYTNAVVDAALLGRPSILICDDKIEDYLQIERFYLSRVDDLDSLNKSISQVKDNLEEFQKKADEFARYHIEKGSDSVRFIADFILSVYRDEVTEPLHFIKGQF